MNNNILTFWNEVVENKKLEINDKPIKNNDINSLMSTDDSPEKRSDEMKSRIETLTILNNSMLRDIKNLSSENKNMKHYTSCIIKQMSKIISKFMDSDIMAEVIYDEAMNSIERGIEKFDFDYLEEIVESNRKDNRPISVIFDEHVQQLSEEEKSIDLMKIDLDNVISLREYRD